MLFLNLSDETNDEKVKNYTTNEEICIGSL